MKIMETTNEFIIERTGIEKRYWVAPEMGTSDLGLRACQAALDDAGLTADDVDLLVMNTLTPDCHNPGCGFFLRPKLGLENKPVFDIRQGCAAVLYALSLAEHYIGAGTYGHVLVVCSETNSKFLDPSNKGRNLAALVGDGAGALVLGPTEEPGKGIESVILHADGTGAKHLCTVAPGCAAGRNRHLTHEDVESGQIYDRMNGRYVYENGVEKMTDVMHELLEANSLSIGDVDLIVPHQPNLRMLEEIAKRSGFPEEKFFINVRDHGNMASATTPIALDQARRSGRLQQGDLVLLVGFGAGFSWGAALVRM
jgi:3-oxoacyl-[acyl-carrier-protein] synthase-3